MGNTKELDDDLDRLAGFELYRRNLRNPEILTFDELLARARFIVASSAPDQAAAHEAPTQNERGADARERCRPVSPDTTPSQVLRFVVSQRVLHPKFGDGHVEEVLDRLDDQELRIDFAKHGRKRLMAGMAALQILD